MQLFANSIFERHSTREFKISVERISGQNPKATKRIESHAHRIFPFPTKDLSISRAAGKQAYDKTPPSWPVVIKSGASKAHAVGLKRNYCAHTRAIAEFSARATSGEREYTRVERYPRFETRI